MQFPYPKTTAGVLLLALLQACGGGGGDDANSSDATAAAPATPTATSAAPAPAPAASSPTSSAPSPDTTCGLANFESDALRLVNQQRAAGATCGSRGSFAPAAALTWNARLAGAAYGHSRDMADKNYFSHDSLDGRSMADRINATGYTWSTIGENIAAGYNSVQSVVSGWMASEGHCANLMNPRFTELGLACARNDASTYRTYWSQEFGRP
jgi:uncharacterized protein YkwD